MRISIVMPTYNGMGYVQQAVESLLQQDYEEWELIISDDGSRDGTREYLATLQGARVKVHRQEKNLGIFGNLNFLFRQASCEITQIFCQDDYFVDCGALGRLVAEWEKLPGEVAFLRCNHELANANSPLCALEREVLPERISPKMSDIYFAVFGCIPGNLSNVSVRTAAVREAGWFRADLPYAGDFEFWSRLGRKASWALTETKTIFVRSHSGQASNYLNFKGELLPQMREVLEALYPNAVAAGASARLLRLLMTINYVAQHKDRGVKSLLLKRDGTYLRVVMREFDRGSFAYGPFLSWVVFFGSLGGRLFRVPLARRLFREMAVLGR
ncbi:MAG: glycosyltransferase family 2 protein [Acidobacteriaceae bacterium]